MSSRELRAILADQLVSNDLDIRTARRRNRKSQLKPQAEGGAEMSEEDEGNLQQRLREAERRLELAEAAKESELRKAYQELDTMSQQAESYKKQMDGYVLELERVKINIELEKHRALDSLRVEHASQIKFLQSQAERECERTDNWISELRERIEREKDGLVQRIRMLENDVLQYQIQLKHSNTDECGDPGPITESGPSKHSEPLNYSGNCKRDDMYSNDVCFSQTITSEQVLLPTATSYPGQSMTAHSHESEASNSGATPRLITEEPLCSFIPKSGASTDGNYHRNTESTVQHNTEHMSMQEHTYATTDVQKHILATAAMHGQTNDNVFQASVQGHTADHERIPVSMFNQSTDTHVQSPSPLVHVHQQNADTVTAPESNQSYLVQSITELLKAQTQMLAAQAQAASIQSLPSLPTFTGEESQTQLFDEDFEHWLKSFEERAKVAKWTDDQKLYQLKAHLTKTALQLFRLLPEDDKCSYNKAVKALKKRFKPTDIEELRGIEFNQKMQENESIEQLGIELQNLGRKAFPRMKEEEFDRLLKGRFFQALLSKWQRKLSAPKPGETFSELYDRARTLERQDKQISATAAFRGDNKSSKLQQGHSRPSTNQKSQRISKDTAPQPVFDQSDRGGRGGSYPVQYGKTQNRPYTNSRGWYVCDAPHRAKECSNRTTMLEAPGRTNSSSRSAQLTVAPTAPPQVSNSAQDVTSAMAPSKFTEEQLVQMLSQCRLEKEEALLQAQLHSKCDAVTAQTQTDTSEAVGPTLQLNVHIEGLPVDAMVDTGSQSTIISRAMLQKVAGKMQEQGKEIPKLRLPSVKLYGKDGDNDRNELHIVAEVTLIFEADGKSVSAPVFVQPNSEQSCLLGMNIAPALGLKFLDNRGSPLKECPSHLHPKRTSNVHLILASTLPGRKGRFLEANLDSTLKPDTEIIFKPATEFLQTIGVGAQDALLRVSDQGKVLIPLQNFEHNSVDLTAGLELGCAEPLEAKFPVEPGTCSWTWPDDPEVSETESKCSKVTTRKQAKHEKDRKMKLKSLLNLPGENLTADQYQEIEKLLMDNSDVFAVSENELGHTNVVKHSIDTGDHPPIKQNPRRTPFVHRDKISQLINDMLKQKVVQPSTSAWASPVVLVPKKDGTLRFCVDYRRINAVTKKDVYPLPRVDDILDTLRKAKFFSTLDLVSGYWQIEMDPATRDKSAFTTHCGLFEFLRMPFGLCNSPATFQRLMQSILVGLERNICYVYLDDILVFSETWQEQLLHLQKVLNRLREAGLTLKPTKCSFLRESIPFLGHVISQNGILPDPAKTSKVRNFPVPTDLSKVRQFLGLASYYRRFIPGFASIANPLHALTKKNVQFEWTTQCQKAFEKLKDLLTSAPVLIYPQFGNNAEFTLETDASVSGLGAVLGQRQQDGLVHPIAYASRCLQSHECNYAITELETLAVVWAVKQFRAYLLGHKCVVYTDHSACTSLLSTPNPSAKLARWAMIIQELNLEIKHRSGKSNSNADALSRNPVLSDAQPPETEPADENSNASDDTLRESDSKELQHEIRLQQREDSDLAKYIAFLEHGELPNDDKCARRLVLEQSQFDVIDGILYHENPTDPGNWKIVVPRALRDTLLTDSHEGTFSGHFAERKVYSTLKKKYWWSGMRSDVRKHCRSCLSCAARKGTGRASRPLLQPIPVGGPFHRVGVDVLQLPLTESGNKYVVVFLDYLTKWVEAFAVQDQSAETIARLLVEEIICRHGAPQELLSDRGANFLSNLIQEVCEILKIKKVNTSGYHPQTDGLVEKFNSTLINMLSKCAEKHSNWDTHLPFLLFAYRSTVQDSVRESPFYLLYGRDPRIPAEKSLQGISKYPVDIDDYKSPLATCLSEAWHLAQANIKKAQAKQKQQYDRHSKQPHYKVGDRVMVYMPSEITGAAWKLAKPFYGPYRILSVTPTNAEVKIIDKPEEPSIFVALSRVRLCYPELPDTSWSGSRRKRRRAKARTQYQADKQN